MTGNSTHWIGVKQRDNKIYYYDSFGNLQTPPELLRYFKGSEVYYNYDIQQSYDSVVCGHLCLKFLSENV